MRSPSDLTVIKRWLKSLNDETFVAMPPPTPDRFTQADAHDDARDEIEERGLQPDTPYVVWHYQAHCFNRSGELTGALSIYFGGNRSEVAAKLASIPEQFVISGGGSDADAFRLQRRLDLTKIDTGDAAAVARVIASLTEGMHYQLDMRPVLAEPLTEEVGLWLHAVLDDPTGDRTNRVAALKVLEGGKAVSQADLSVALGGEGSLFATKEGWDFDVMSAIRPAWAAGRTDAEPLVRAVVASGGEELAEDALLAWPDAASMEQARVRGFTVTAARVRAAVEGREARDIALEDVKVAYQAGDSKSAEALAHALPTIRPGPGGRHDGDLDFDFPQVLDAVRDPGLPTWLRGLVADAYERTYFSMKADADRGALAAFYYERDIAPLLAALAAWPDAVAAVRAELGDEAWRGPDLDDKYGCEDTLAAVRELDDSQERWFHEHVQDAVRRDQPLSLDGWGYLLEPLVANRRFTLADADAVLRVWRKQVVGKADNYQPTQHPLLSLAVGLLQLEHPQATTVVAAIEKQKPKWAQPLKYVLAGYDDPDRREELWQIAASADLDSQHGAMAGYVLLDARLRDISPADAAVQAYHRAKERQASLKHSVSGAAWTLAVEFASGHPRLLNRNAPETDDHQRAVAKIKSDLGLPDGPQRL